MTSSSSTELGFFDGDLRAVQLLELLSYALTEVPPAQYWPMTAAEWIAQGLDNFSLVQLAGLSASDPEHVIREALQRLLSEEGLPLPGREADRFAQVDLVAQIGANDPALGESCCKLLDANYRKNYRDRYQPALEALVLIGSNWDKQWAGELRESAAAEFKAYLRSDSRKEASNLYAVEPSP